MNKQKRYIKVFGIELFGFSFEFELGNLLWFVEEFRRIHPVNRSEKTEDAVATLRHWVKFEKEHRNDITNADELIEMHETVLQYIEDLEYEVRQLRAEVLKERK
ncbi:MAG: hypothetical protein K2P14_10415 [Anaeroplasmataceae bacterium]|nr:hypothetical protein [Anaeroplasmataceae bacterium]